MATLAPAAAYAAAATSRDDDGLDLEGLIGILRRRWKVIAAITFSVALLATLAVFQVTPRYSAASSVAKQTVCRSRS